MRLPLRGMVRPIAALAALVTMAGWWLGAAGPAAALGPTDWHAYLGGPSHTSRSLDPAITPASAPGLQQKWYFDIPYASSPVVADGSVFIGGFNGWFYKINALSGALQDKVFLGFEAQHTCAKFGFATTVTVAFDPAIKSDAVYVAAPNGYLYAFNELTMARLWRSVIAIPSHTVNNYFQWSSPTVDHGKVYVGISSSCDMPLIRGGIAAYAQQTGRKLASYYAVPKGHIGGSVWSTVAVDTAGDVYATTGNGTVRATKLYHTVSILKLSPGLKLLAAFQVPKSQQTGDGDFGGSPTLFNAVVHGKLMPMVGACNKNGIYYALRRSDLKEIWQRRIGVASSDKIRAECIAAAAFDGHHLYMAGPETTIGGKTARGSVEELNPSDGAIKWQTGLPNGVMTSPTINGSGVIGVGTYDNAAAPNATYLVDATTGAILRKLNPGVDFPQTVFAEGWVYSASSSGLYAWGP
jgi:outer membrane protein assembly factor BamB